MIIDEIESIKTYHTHPHVLLLKRSSPEIMARQLLNEIKQYRQRESDAPSPESSYQTFHYANYQDEISKAIEK